MKIQIDFVYPPIPDRRCDYRATFENYDADWDERGYFSHSPVGYGRTEKAAIDDLMLCACPGCGCFRDRCACDLREASQSIKDGEHS